MNFLFRSDQNTRVSKMVGKRKERALLASAPIRLMRSPRSGTAAAKLAAEEEQHKRFNLLYQQFNLKHSTNLC